MKTKSKAQDKKKGFNLIELIIILVIIAIMLGVALPIFNNIMENARRKVTLQNMIELERAIIGDPSTHFLGFRQVMRRNPDPLSELWTTAASAFNPFTGEGQGQRTFVGEEAGIDGWSNPFLWDSDTSTLTSGGIDGDSATGEDNVVKVVGES